MSGKYTKQFRRIIGQKRMTALSHFTKTGKPVPGEKRAVFLARMREEWGRLGDEEKTLVKKEVTVLKQRLPQTEIEKTAYLRRVCSELNELTVFMKQLGWSFNYKITTETNSLESLESLAAAIAPSPTPRPSKREEERTNLRREVQYLFNELHAQATGRRGNFPYKRHAIMPELAVTGMPHGVPFKEPFSYGLPALQAIVAHKNQIKMHLIQASSSEHAAPVTSVEDTTAAVSVEETPLKQEHCIPEEVLLKQEHSIVEAFLKQECSFVEVLPLKQEHSIAEGVLLKWEHVKAEEIPLNTGTCCKRPRVGDQHYGPYEVKKMEISPPEPKVIAALPPQESTDVPVNVAVVHPLNTNVQSSGVLDANAIPESQHPQQGPAEKSAMKRAGTKSQWTAEEVATVHQHFREELEGRRLVEIRKIKEFVSGKKFSRTVFAVQNFLLRNRLQKRKQD